MLALILSQSVSWNTIAYCLGVSPGTLDVRTFCIREFTKDITNLFYSRPKIGLKIGYYL